MLIFTASVGEGHDLPARTLAAQLRDEDPAAEVVIRDGLAPLGRAIQLLSDDAPQVVFYRFRWAWDAAYWTFAVFGPTRSLARASLARMGGPGLARVIDDVRPDVVVSTYPQTTEVLGALRRQGRLRVPAFAAITDLTPLAYWAASGIDVHLITHPESEEEVRRIAGAGTEIVCVHGLTRPEFVRPATSPAARLALGLPSSGKIVTVSGGGWGVGDLAAAAEVALGLPDVALVVCLCGRNDELRRRLAARFRNERVRVEGFTDRMSDWLAAADALVHSTGGLTILEAHIRGCPAISFGWGRGHVRYQDRAFRRFGLADVVRSRDALAPALRLALARRKPQDLSFARLPSAASVVLRYACAGTPAAATAA